MSQIEFEKECQRKEMLLKLFESLESRERKFLRKGPAGRSRKYERMFKGSVSIMRIHNAHVQVHRHNSKKMKPLALSPEICKLLREGDELFLTAGQIGSEWRVVYVAAIGSHIPPEEEKTNVIFN